MSKFNFYGIPIRLPNTGQTIMVTIRDDHDPASHSVVFVDAQKLSPYMDAINARENSQYLASKQAGAREGFLLAAVADESSIAECESPLPMAIVGCYLRDGKPHIGFVDGIARTTEMIRQGAQDVPLEIFSSEAELLHRTVGGKRPPEAASYYVVSPDIRTERMITYSRRRNEESADCK